MRSPITQAFQTLFDPSSLPSREGGGHRGRHLDPDRLATAPSIRRWAANLTGSRIDDVTFPDASGCTQRGVDQPLCQGDSTTSSAPDGTPSSRQPRVRRVGQRDVARLHHHGVHVARALLASRPARPAPRRAARPTTAHRRRHRRPAVPRARPSTPPRRAHVDARRVHHDGHGPGRRRRSPVVHDGGRGARVAGLLAPGRRRPHDRPRARGPGQLGIVGLHRPRGCRPVAGGRRAARSSCSASPSWSWPTRPAGSCTAWPARRAPVHACPSPPAATPVSPSRCGSGLRGFSERRETPTAAPTPKVTAAGRAVITSWRTDDRHQLRRVKTANAAPTPIAATALDDH